MLRQQPDPEGLSRAPLTGKVNEERLAKIRSLSPDEQRLLAIVPNLYIGFLVRLAFNESIALYGLVLALISKSFLIILPFAIVSFVLNWSVPPMLDSDLEHAASLGFNPAGMPIAPQ